MVSLENGFGYRLDGTTGIRIPWLAIPSDSGNLRPFTISLGVAFDEPEAVDTIVSAAAGDGSFSLVISMNRQTTAPQAMISGGGSAPLLIQWSGPAIAAKERVLLSLSIVPQPAGLSAQWFLDGVQVSSLSQNMPLNGARQDGSISIGGDHGFKGVVDEFGVYAQDSTGRPSTDPDLYSRAQAGLHGARLVLADGFDGILLSNGFSLEGRGQLATGIVTLAAGALLALPPLKTGPGVSLVARLAPGSGRTAVLSVQWEGSSVPPAVMPLAADASALSFRIAPNGQAIIIASTEGERSVNLPSPASSGTSLLLKIGNPTDARSDLLIESILALASP